MNSPEVALREVILASMPDVGVYPVIAPTTAKLPFIVYRRAAIIREATFLGPLGHPKVTAEITIIDRTYEGVRQTADTVRQTIDGWTGIVDNVLIQQTHLTQESDSYAQLQGAEMPEVYTVTQSYEVIWKET